MRVDVPVLVQQRPAGEGREASVAVAPLFVGTPGRVARRLDRALARLGNDLREHLNALAARPDHGPLAAALFSPPVETVRVKAELTLRRRTLRGAWALVLFRVGEQRVGFLTGEPDRWLHFPEGGGVEGRAVEALTARALAAERDGRPPPEPLAGQAWVTQVPVNVAAVPSLKEEKLDLASLFGGSRVGSGAEELPRVGRSVDALYPDGLPRAAGRAAETDALAALLARDDRPSVLLVGPRGVGKTALVHASVRRRLDEAGGRVGDRGQTWAVSPPRLISGMSHVGQWEERLLAILEHAKAKDHTLLVDDVPGLFSAGRSSQSDVTVGQVLKPFVERRDVRVVGELTPEAHAVLREIDRGFADLFQVVPVAEPDARAARGMLVSAVREVEGRQGCRFDADVLPAVLDLANRYVRDAALPGRAATLLTGLGARHAEEAVTRADAAAAFRERSGLPASYVDADRRLSRSEVVEALGAEVFGQPAAIEAMADVVCVGKARLGDPRRPLGSLLFLGPTGVGKTECAKALAAYLYGDAQRLLRFDMNSFNDPGAAARLVGTLHAPDGLLTSAVRRQPFAVLLLDEVEKADPGVHDLLLQVLGEGRLTDALGRTADFGNAVVVLTSNLGAERAMTGRLGFAPAAAEGLPPDAVYVDAARGFFRPELFNRFDRIVPFSPLGRGDVERVAERLVDGLLQREGLARRRCVLRVDPAARAFLVDRGFDRRFGARAMRRAVEEELARPVARRLAEMPGEAAVLIDVNRGAGGLAVTSSAVTPAARRAWPPAGLLAEPRAELIGAMEDATARLGAAVEALRSAAGGLSGKPTPAQLARLALQEELADTRRKLEKLARASAPRAMRNRIVSAPHRRGWPGAPPQRAQVDAAYDWRPAPADAWTQALRADDAAFHLKQLAGAPAGKGENAEGLPHDLLETLAQLVWAEAVCAAAAGGDAAPAASLVLRGVGTDDAEALAEVGAALAAAFDLPWGLEAVWRPGGPGAGAVGVVTLDGPGAAALAAAEAGTHAFADAAGRVQLFSAIAVPGADAAAARAALGEAERAWRAALLEGRDAERPHPLGPVHRITAPGRTTLDLRTGLMTVGAASPRDLLMFVLSRLPLPRELREEPP